MKPSSKLSASKADDSRDSFPRDEYPVDVMREAEAELDDDFLRHLDGGSDRDEEVSMDDKEPSASDFYTTRKKSSAYPEWPMINIKEVHENDILYGRGGGTNHHPGNKRFRQMVEELKLAYVNSNRKEKPTVALRIVREWRAQEPPGRFLMHNDITKLWHDVGDKKAREKTSQALREKAPQIRKQQEEQDKKEVDKKDVDKSNEAPIVTKVKADAPTRSTKKGPNKGKLKRIVHSLGFECDPSDFPDLRNFSWDKGDDVVPNKTDLNKVHSPPRKDIGPTEYIPSSTHSRSSSSSYFPPTKMDGYPMPREHSLNGYPSPMPPPQVTYPMHTFQSTPDPIHGYRNYYHHGAPMEGQYIAHPIHVKPPPNYHRSDSHHSSSSTRSAAHSLWDTDGVHDISRDWMARGQQPPGHGGTFEHPRNISYGSSFPDPLMYPHSRSESMNSTGSLVWLDDKRSPDRKVGPECNNLLMESSMAVDFAPKINRPSTSHENSSPMTSLPKPGIVKRETSHKNENAETKPHRDKRPVRKKLQSRGSSIGSINIGEVDDLGSSLEQSTLIDSSDAFDRNHRPQSLSDTDRMTSAMAVKLEFSNEIVVTRDFLRPFPIQPDDRLISIRSIETTELLADDIHTISDRPSVIQADQRISSAETEIISNLLRH